MIQQSHFLVYIQRKRDTCIPMFNAALFIKAKNGNNLSVCQKIKKGNVVYIYNGILFSLKKEGFLAIYNTMDEPRGHCAK